MSLPVYAICGDAVTDAGEQCDDGNTNDEDGCNANCQVECGRLQGQFINPSFEFPFQTNGTRSLLDESLVPAWLTSAPSNQIELVGDVSSPDGENHIAMKTSGPTNVYQYFDVVPGTRIDWSFSHKTDGARFGGLLVYIGTNANDLQITGLAITRQNWRVVSGQFTVPQGVYQMRFQVNGWFSDNVLDNIQIAYPDIGDVNNLADCALDSNATFRSDDTGRIQLIGNGMLTCNDAASGCSSARDYQGSQIQNAQYDLVQIDADGDGATFNSSSANLDLDVNETVTWAGLYWIGGYTDFGKTTITEPVDAASRGTVKFRTPSGGYVDVTGTVTDLESRFYRGFANVTDSVTESGDYWVADMQLSQGQHMVAGWALVVVTSDPDLPLRSMTVIDPFERVEDRGRVAVTSFAAAHPSEADMEFGYVVLDGDPRSTDFVFINDNQLIPDAPDASQPSDRWDIGNSSITWYGNNVTTRSPAYRNNFGFDIDIFDAATFSNGETDIEVEIQSIRDQMLAGVFTFQTDLQIASPISANTSRFDGYEIVDDAFDIDAACSTTDRRPGSPIFLLLVALLSLGWRRKRQA